MIGSAGSADKVRYLTEEVGFDAAFNYKDAPVGEQLGSIAPTGIDVYFDNVGGEHLEAAINAFRASGRAAECGMISQINNYEPEPGPRNMVKIVRKRLKLRRFIVFDHAYLRDQFHAEVGQWLNEGKIQHRETVVDGLRNTPDAFLAMLRGENTGKMLVNIANGS